MPGFAYGLRIGKLQFASVRAEIPECSTPLHEVDRATATKDNFRSQPMKLLRVSGMVQNIAQAT